jgi:hypothetical protein
MGLNSSTALRALVVLGVGISAAIGLKLVQQPADPAWTASINSEHRNRHTHPGMDDATLLSITPVSGHFSTTMHSWFPLYDRLEAKGLVEIERHDGMYVVRRLAQPCPGIAPGDMRNLRCG